MIGALAALVLAGCGASQIGLGGGMQLLDQPTGLDADPTVAARLEARCDGSSVVRGELQFHATLGGRDSAGSVSVRNTYFAAPILLTARWPSESLFALAGGLGPELSLERISTTVGESNGTQLDWGVTLHGQMGLSVRYRPVRIRLMALARLDDRTTFGGLLFASFAL